MARLKRIIIWVGSLLGMVLVGIILVYFRSKNIEDQRESTIWDYRYFPVKKNSPQLCLPWNHRRGCGRPKEVDSGYLIKIGFPTTLLAIDDGEITISIVKIPEQINKDLSISVINVGLKGYSFKINPDSIIEVPTDGQNSFVIIKALKEEGIGKIGILSKVLNPDEGGGFALIRMEIPHPIEQKGAKKEIPILGIIDIEIIPLTDWEKIMDVIKDQKG